MRALRKRCLQGLLLVGLVPKFLVPLGYMPAAIADGGPLMLCDTFAPVPAVADAPRRHAEPGAHAADAGHTAHAAQSGHAGHAVPAAPDQRAAGHGHGDAPATDDDHAEWERCSLGGLAALTAVTTDWRVTLVATADERVAPAVTLIDTRANRIVFRSRAPPAPWNSVR